MKLCVSVCLQVVLVGGLWGSVRQEPDPEVLIDKYNACNKKFETIYYDLGTTVVQFGSKKYVYTLKYCSSNEKKQWIGRMKCYNKDGTVDQRGGTLVADIFNEKRGVHLRHYNPEFRNELSPRASMLSSSRDKAFQQYSANPEHGGPLTGKLYGSNDQSIYDLLKGASNLKLHNEVTKIMGYDTYHIEADTQYGVVKAWISPDLGYNCLKWEIIKEPNQFYRDGQLTNDRFTGWTAVYDAEKVEQIDGHYFVTQAKFNRKVKDGYKVLANSTFHYNLKNIDLNPDFEALGGFKIRLPEGTVVTDNDFPGVRYEWIGDRLQPLIDDIIIDALDSAVDEFMESRKIVPKKQVEKSEVDGAVKQSAKVDGKQLPNQEIAKTENEEKNDLRTNTKRLVCSVIIVFVILVIAFFVYRYRRNVGNNEK
ncbi:MAG: hypothetical protein ACYS1A_17980 [Planctomycetota bacterium]|jgi:hypothetical protein